MGIFERFIKHPDPVVMPPPRRLDVALSFHDGDGDALNLLACVMDDFEHGRLVYAWVNQDVRGSYRMTIDGEEVILALELGTITRILAKPIEAPGE